MMPAAKHGDPQLGVDIHLCVVPPSPSPVPLPTPHTSIVFDPFDYVPILGATITVCGMKRATAGTSATAIHIPPGFPFAPKLPDKDDEIFMGSSTVVADGDPFSFTAVPTLSCQVAGMISPPRLKKKNKKLMLLPTTVNLAIPTNVFVGGAPTISLLGMAFKGVFSALGRFARSGLFRRIRQRLFRNLNPGFLKCAILRAEPVNILSGEVSLEHEDFTLPGRIPLEWRRIYSSGTHRAGLCGYGWETPADIRIEVDPSTGSASMIQPTGGPLFFDRLPIVLGDETAELELMDGALLSDQGDEYRILTKEDRVFSFSKAHRRISENGVTEYPLVRIADLCGNWLAFERQNEKPVAINESAGCRIEFAYDNDYITEVVLYVPETEMRRVFVRYAYNSAGNLVSVIDALDKPYTFAYDKHHMVRHTDRNGLSFYYEYDNKSLENDWRVVHAWGDGDLYNYYFGYLDPLYERRITDSLGHTSLVKLNEAGLPISEIDPLGGMVVFEYDERGRTSAVTDQDGNRTEYEYDEHGNLLKLTRPDGKCVETEFNSANKATKIIGCNSAEWQQDWDARGLIILRCSPLGAKSFYDYDSYGQLIGFTDPMGAHTTMTWDGQGNLTGWTDALGQNISFDYDEHRNLIAKTDPMGGQTLYRYDLKNRLMTATLPEGATIEWLYDNEDNIIRYINANGVETHFNYCGLGNVMRRIQPDGYSVEYHYDTQEQLIGITNQRDEHFRFIRDPLGRIIEEVDYWDQKRFFSYSAAGHLIESTDPLGRIIHYETDQLGRITQKTIVASDSPELWQHENFAYDANDNLILFKNNNICVECSFDAEDRLIEEHQGQDFSITNTYDLNGNRIGTNTVLNIGKHNYVNTVTYRYNVLDECIGVEVLNHDPMQFIRNAQGQITQEIFGPHLRRDSVLNSNGEISTQQVLSKEFPLFKKEYGYDKIGNLVEKKDSILGADQFTYDPLSHLIKHLNPEKQLRQYAIDPAGNQLVTHVIQPGENDQGHPKWYSESIHNGTQYRFDRAGNLINCNGPHGETYLSWDADMRLRESRTNGQTTCFLYDALGRRISKQTSRGTIKFYWDGDALLGDACVKDSGNGHSELKLLRHWIYYPETFEPLVLIQDHPSTSSGELQRENEAIFVYDNDPNGTPTRLLSLSGEIVWACQYDIWGEVEKIVIGQVNNPLRLQGQYFDEELGFSYNRFRYFNAATGSFVSKDPLGLDAGPNPYWLAPNEWQWIDPLGLMCATPRRSVWQRIRNFFLGRKPPPAPTGRGLTRDEARELFRVFRESGSSVEEANRLVRRAHEDARRISDDVLGPGPNAAGNIRAADGYRPRGGRNKGC